MSAYMKAVEQRLSMGDVTPRGWRVKSNLDAFLRSDSKTRVETYAIGKPLGIYPDERLEELEDIPRVERAPQQPMGESQSTGGLRVVPKEVTGGN
jgi:hypothetical protein